LMEAHSLASRRICASFDAIPPGRHAQRDRK